jgi:hypothetical protein
MPLMQAVTDSHSGLLRQMDITAPEGEVQVQISADGKVLWVHVEGVTVLRVCRCEKITIENQRKKILTEKFLSAIPDLNDLSEEELIDLYNISKEVIRQKILLGNFK